MEPVRLEVFADVACPWCLVGHRRLDRALAEEAPGSVEVRWRAFQLAPELPAEGVDRREYYERKFGRAASEDMFERVRSAGREEGLALEPLAAEKAVNTHLAHRAWTLSLDPHRAIEALMRAYLEEGEDVGDAATVAHILERQGLAPEDLVTRLEAGEAADAVDQDIALAGQLGLHAVPAFVADASFALSGAHEPELLRKLLRAARDRRDRAAA